MKKHSPIPNYYDEEDYGKAKPGFFSKIRRRHRFVNSSSALFLLSVFQLICFFNVAYKLENGITLKSVTYFFMLFAYIVFEWGYVILMTLVAKKKNFELEIIAFFLCGIGLTVITSITPEQLKTQLISVILGVIIFDVLLWFLQDVKRTAMMRLPLAVIALLFFLGSFVYIRFVVGPTNGAYNWIKLGGFSIQPAEFVKIAFIWVGSATLDKLLRTKSNLLWLGFVVGCLGVLVLMKDFGTAMIFFFSFIVITYMRSGDWKIVLASLGVGAAGVGGIIIVKPYVAKRFQGWGHVWDYVNESQGYQQARTLVYSASGGLLGIGIANGKLRNVFASTNDLIFGVICEELGLIMGFAIVIAFALICIFAVINAKTAPSSFYAVAACTASAMLLFQTCLNIFGITDILPLTGVTLPFVSQGGSSMICSWALFAFIKAADIRTYPKLIDYYNN